MDWKRIKESLANAFAVDDGRGEITPEDIALLDRVAGFVVRRHLTLPAVMALETAAPLNFLGSSLMTFFHPIVGVAFSTIEYERLERLLDKRCSPALLIERIELAERQQAEGGKK